MSSTLSAATQDRKARLAQLKSLKRKQPDTYQETSLDDPTSEDGPPASKSPRRSTSPAPGTPSYLSGRNYDPTTRGPKLGFETAPSSNQSTLEVRAAELAATTKLQAAKDAEEDKPLDLFKLQPKKPNWDLKRDLERKLEVLNVRTENAIARLVRERIVGAQGRAKAQGKATAAAEGTSTTRTTDDGLEGEAGDGEEVGMDGAVLLEATKEREREDEEDARRERQLDEELLDGS